MKTVIETMIRKYAEQVNQNNFLEEEIPHVGKLVIRNNTAAVIFNKSLLESTRFATAKRYESIFDKNNMMNNKLLEPNRAMFGLNAHDLNLNSSLEQFEPVAPRNIDHSAEVQIKKLQLHTNGEYKNNMRNTFKEGTAPQTPELSHTRSNNILQKRAMSTFSTDRLTHKSMTRFSQPSTFLSRVPELAPF